ncbi:homoserine dehydrogenase [Thermoproteota archaeon]
MLTIGLLGLGTVGSGVLEILTKNHDILKHRTGKILRVKTILDKDKTKKGMAHAAGAELTQNIDDILNDPEIAIVIEAMGGEHPAYEYICKALEKGKYVVTSNKEVVAKHKMTFFKLAKKHDTDIFFEATVCGGVPLIRTLKIGLAANQTESLYGILNGTTNYILTRIEREQKEFKEVLKQAQDLGLAEANPSMDISGLDAAYKLVILAAVAFKADVCLEDIYYEGIETIALRDIQYAIELGYRIKLLAIGCNTTGGSNPAVKSNLEADAKPDVNSRREVNQLGLSVYPVMIPLTHPLASIHDEFTAVYTTGNMVGETLLTGKGAGALPTASAVVSDLIDICFEYGKKVTARNLEVNLKPKKVVPLENSFSQFYIRLTAVDTYGVLEKIAGVFGRCHISISKLIQKDAMEKKAEIVIVTHSAKEGNMAKAVSGLKMLKDVSEVSTVIRVGLG